MEMDGSGQGASERIMGAMLLLIAPPLNCAPESAAINSNKRSPGVCFIGF